MDNASVGCVTGCPLSGSLLAPGEKGPLTAEPGRYVPSIQRNNTTPSIENYFIHVGKFKEWGKGLPQQLALSRPVRKDVP
jgi:hypothetical protein